jgi:hypothetical protein
MSDALDVDLSQHTLILTEGEKVLFASDERGITPLLACMDRFFGYGGRCTLHDRVTGLAAARLVVHGGFIVEVVTRVISLPAKDFLTNHGIRLLSGEIVPGIINRAKTGACPAETIAHKTKDIREMIFLLSRLGNPISS